VYSNSGTLTNDQSSRMARLPDVTPAFEWTQRYGTNLHIAYRTIADHVYGRLGRFAYAAFDYLNATFFQGKLPETLLLWDLTDHGHFLGWCRSSAEGPPIIKLHPALVAPAARPPDEPVWHMPLSWFGWCLAYDVLLHECVHASVDYLLGGWEYLLGQRSYWSCHNNPVWVAEVNRIAPLLGYTGDAFTMKLPRRVSVPGSVGPRGKPLTRSVRAQHGNAPDFEHFPHCLPGREAFYLGRELPFTWK
jgi:hypothetical protein